MNTVKNLRIHCIDDSNSCYIHTHNSKIFSYTMQIIERLLLTLDEKTRLELFKTDTKVFYDSLDAIKNDEKYTISYLYKP